MSWFMTADTAEFLSVAGEFLRAEPARNSVMLTVTADLEAAGPGAGDRGMLFGWRRAAGGPPTAAFMHTPGYPAMLSGMSETAAAELARDLTGAGHRVPGVNAAQQAADAFTAVWRDRTGDAVTVHRRMRLFRLGRLAPPAPRPEGGPRPAAGADRDLLAGWFAEFALEIGNALYERLGYRAVEDRVLLSFEPPVTLHP